jgi:hypothetical protein
VILLIGTSSLMAQDVSPPVILQDFESSYRTIENRAADIFAAGYGTVYTPPPGRADSGNQSVGYDQYDRFDLGGPGNPTLYGTETGLKQAIGVIHQMGGNWDIDLVWNHAGYSDTSTAGGAFAQAGGYPGLVLTLQTSNPNAPGYNTKGYNAVDGDFHSAYATGDQDMRLAGLVDIDQYSNYQFIRNPVDPNDPNNIPAGTTAWNGRLANIADPANARFYPDKSLQPIMVYDPKTGEQNIAIYPFNNANPAAGTPVQENALGYLMRNAQWLVQSVGVDGFRIDAAKNMPADVLNYYDRAVYRSSTRTLLDGSQEQVNAFSEVYDSNQDLLQSYVRKDIDPNNPGTKGGNRDAHDFTLFFAMKSNLSSNGVQNDWNNVVNASFDLHDDGKQNGSQGVKFVSSHDNTGPDLSNVAYAYTLMLPGNAIVYYNAHQFGDNRAFPQDGRGDALGGVYGDAIPTLVDLRNRYGRGNYIPRLLEKENFAFERDNSALVFLSNRSDAGYDSRTIQTDFAPGSPLIELTGNAHNAFADPHGDIPQLLVVKSDGTVDFRFLRNSTTDLNNNAQFTGDGYLVYGLPTPRGTMNLGNVSQVLPGSVPNAQTDPDLPYANGATRLANIDVIKGNSFQVSLQTNAVMIDGYGHDAPADGDNAIIKIDGGLDLNGNGHVDYTQPNTVSYGFEQFGDKSSPLWGGGDGQFIQTVDVAGLNLSEGMHFIEVRAFRHRDDGGPPVYSDWKQTIYVDRFKPIASIDSFNDIQTGVNENRRLQVRSTDMTADNMHVFFDLPADLTDQQVLAMVGGASQTSQIDRDLFTKDATNLTSGNHVATVVTYEIDGNYNVQRFPGLYTSTIYGRGLGDTNFNGTLGIDDINTFQSVLYSQNQQFNPAADLNADGRIDSKDLFMLKAQLAGAGADSATLDAAHILLLHRGDVNGDGHTNAADIDYLFNHLTSYAWTTDLNSDDTANHNDVDTLVQTILGTQYGDSDLNGDVTLSDLATLAGNYGRSGGWADGDFTGNALVNFADLSLLLDHYDFSTGTGIVDGSRMDPTAISLLKTDGFTVVPEPAALWFMLLGLWTIRINRSPCGGRWSPSSKRGAI